MSRYRAVTQGHRRTSWLAAGLLVVVAGLVDLRPVVAAGSGRLNVTILASTVDLAHGELRFEAPGIATRPRRPVAKVLEAATAAAGSEARGVRPRVLFGLFSATSPARRAADGSVVPVFSRRPVWIVRYAQVRVRRSTGVVSRRVPQSTRQTTTTLDPVAVVDIVVVIDDRDGRQVLRSEFEAERVVGIDVPATTTTVRPVRTVPALELLPMSTVVGR